MTKYIYIQGTDYQRKPTHFMARKMISREPHYVIVAKFTNEAEAQNAVSAANMKEHDERGAYVRGVEAFNEQELARTRPTQTLNPDNPLSSYEQYRKINTGD